MGENEPKWTPEWRLEKQMHGLDMGGNHQVAVTLNSKTSDGRRRVILGGGRLKDARTQSVLADAQLFKAAPKLYAALEKALGVLLWFHCSFPEHELSEELDEITTVLAEARGEGGGQ